MHTEILSHFRSEIILTARNISLAYGNKRQAQPVLEDVSLDLHQGEVLALLGASGAGKSSLLRVLAGLQKPTEGTVNIRGEAVKGPHPRLGFVFQDACLLPWLTLEENVAFGMDFKHQPRISKAEKQARTEAAIADVDLLHARGRYPAELSGGMAQRTALARTLARQPEILLLDEPFSALDPITRREMQQRLLQLTAKYHASAVMVTHDIDEALLVADRVVLMGGSPGEVSGVWANTAKPVLSAGSTSGKTGQAERPEQKHRREHLRDEILAALEAVSTRQPGLAVAA